MRIAWKPKWQGLPQWADISAWAQSVAFFWLIGMWRRRQCRMRRIWDFQSGNHLKRLQQLALPYLPGQTMAPALMHMLQTKKNGKTDSFNEAARPRSNPAKPSLKKQTKLLGKRGVRVRVYPRQLLLSPGIFYGEAGRRWNSSSIHHQFPRRVRFNWFACGDCIIMCVRECVPRRANKRENPQWLEGQTSVTARWQLA